MEGEKLMFEKKWWIGSMSIINAMKIMLAMYERNLLNSRDIRAMRIYAKKLGDLPFYIRRKTTDVILARILLGRAGQYDFIYSLPYIKYLQEAHFIIDAGANIGIFSRMCRAINSNVQIVAIEPEECNFEILQRNVEKCKDISVLKRGLWNKNAKLKILAADGGEVAFRVKEVDENSEYDIDGVSMPTILRDFSTDAIDILKVDIEGAEYEVFDKTCENWIDMVKILIIEFHDDIKPGVSSKIVERMNKHGYQFEIYNENYVFRKCRGRDY